MRIVCVADPHGLYRKLNIPDGDILIFAGDLVAFGFEYEYRDFNKWLGDLPHENIITIAGNHDGYLSIAGILRIEELLDNSIYLENCGVELDGKMFWGSPMTPTFANWYFMANRGGAISRYWNLIPKDVDILITHGPPYGILDKSSYTGIDDGGHVGCEDLLNTVVRIKPQYHIFGHIHEDYGKKTIGATTYINASVVDEKYKLVNKPIIIDIPEKFDNEIEKNQPEWYKKIKK